MYINLNNPTIVHKLCELSMEQVTDLLGLLMDKLSISILSITHTFQILGVQISIEGPIHICCTIVCFS